jgi:dynein heavy chain, axonemal
MFVSYSGAFNAALRSHLLHECWIPDLRSRGIPLAVNPDPITFLSSPAVRATWALQGLPGDSVSTENAVISCQSRRYILLIDPQLQGISWIRGKDGPRGLIVLRQGERKFLDIVSRCVEEGTPLLIENVSETLDSALEPLVQRRTLRRGRSHVLILGGREVILHDDFRLYLHTKLPNPHYGPEIAAQVTIINFSVTLEGLEEQLLADVVRHEASDLAEASAVLGRQLAEYEATLAQLEDDLLARYGYFMLRATTILCYVL